MHMHDMLKPAFKARSNYQKLHPTQHVLICRTLLLLDTPKLVLCYYSDAKLWGSSIIPNLICAVGSVLLRCNAHGADAWIAHKQYILETSKL